MHSHLQLLLLHCVRQPLICVLPDVILRIITSPADAFTDTHPFADTPEFLTQHARASVDCCCVLITDATLLYAVPFLPRFYLVPTIFPPFRSFPCNVLVDVDYRTVVYFVWFPPRSIIVCAGAVPNCKVSRPKKSIPHSRIRPHHLRRVGLQGTLSFTLRVQSYNCATCVVYWV